MKLVFAGAPPFAASILQDVINSEHQVIAVFTQPDRPSGRGRKLMPSAVKMLAEQYHLPVHQPISLKTEETFATLQNLHADIMVVVAYGLLLPQTILKLPRLGCINVHASLLPRFRGAAPIQRAILENENKTGVTIMQMDAGLDTGDILLTQEYVLTPTDTLSTVEKTLAILGGHALLHVLSEKHSLTPTKQNNTMATYAHKITKLDTQLQWGQSANSLDCRVRALNPRPVAHTLLEGEFIKIHKTVVLQETTAKAPGTIVRAAQEGIDVAAGNGSMLRLVILQLPGKKPIKVSELLHAKASLFTPGKSFTS